MTNSQLQVERTFDLLDSWGCFGVLTDGEKKTIKQNLEHIRTETIDDMNNRIGDIRREMKKPYIRSFK